TSPGRTAEPRQPPSPAGKGRTAMRKPRLMTPGPSPVPEDVLLELARPVIHHRSVEAKQVVADVVEGLKYAFQTRNDVLILAASGTGSMEAAVVNTVPAGSKAI